MMKRGIPKDDALDICETLPEIFIEFLAMLGLSARDSAISAKDDLDQPETRETTQRPQNNDLRVA